jgi:hypothetical protein
MQAHRLPNIYLLSFLATPRQFFPAVSAEQVKVLPNRGNWGKNEPRI